MALRLALYQSQRSEFGCTADAEICTCPKHLRIPALDDTRHSDLFAVIRGDYALRIRFLLRHESMVAMGCRFRPGDLSPGAWRDLVTLAEERAWMRGQIEATRERIRGTHGKEERAVAEARHKAGIPAPGQSLLRKGGY